MWFDVAKVGCQIGHWQVANACTADPLSQLFLSTVAATVIFGWAQSNLCCMVLHGALSALEFSVSDLRNSIMQKLDSNARLCISRSLRSLPWNWNSTLTWQNEKDSVVCCLYVNYLLCLSSGHGQFLFTEVCHLSHKRYWSHPQFLVHQQLRCSSTKTAQSGF